MWNSSESDINRGFLERERDSPLSVVIHCLRKSVSKNRAYTIVLAYVSAFEAELMLSGLFLFWITCFFPPCVKCVFVCWLSFFFFFSLDTHTHQWGTEISNIKISGSTLKDVSAKPQRLSYQLTGVLRNAPDRSYNIFLVSLKPPAAYADFTPHLPALGVDQGERQRAWRSFTWVYLTN